MPMDSQLYRLFVQVVNSGISCKKLAIPIMNDIINNMNRFSFKKNNPFADYNKAFTLLELIIVIIIIGILATVGFTTYTNQVESSRAAEARASIGSMRNLAYEYYLKNGSMDDIEDSDVGVDNACHTTSYFRYQLGNTASNCVNLRADRCTAGGKSPNRSTSYSFGLSYFPASSLSKWYANDAVAAQVTGAPQGGSICP